MARLPPARPPPPTPRATLERISETTLLHLAKKWIQPQAVVIGHANLPIVTHLFGPITAVIRSRNLRTVTLDDVWYGAPGRDRLVGAL